MFLQNSDSNVNWVVVVKSSLHSALLFPFVFLQSVNTNFLSVRLETELDVKSYIRFIPQVEFTMSSVSVVQMTFDVNHSTIGKTSMDWKSKRNVRIGEFKVVAHNGLGNLKSNK